MEQFQNTIEKYHTVGTIPKYNRKNAGKSKIPYKRSGLS
jgi:hypothetical protein